MKYLEIYVIHQKYLMMLVIIIFVDVIFVVLIIFHLVYTSHSLSI